MKPLLALLLAAQVLTAPSVRVHSISQNGDVLVRIESAADCTLEYSEDLKTWQVLYRFRGLQPGRTVYWFNHTEQARHSATTFYRLTKP